MAASKTTNVFRAALTAAVLAEGAAAMSRLRERSDVFRRAQARAAALGRPLVVVGDPNAGAHTSLMPAYGCGDVCLDLTGCPACPRSHVADITRRTPLPDDGAVVFVSCTLEYVDDLDAATQEILRIAGSSQNVFVVSVQPWTLTAALYPGARRTVRSPPGGVPSGSAVSGARKVASVLAIAALVVAASGVLDHAQPTTDRPAR